MPVFEPGGAAVITCQELSRMRQSTATSTVPGHEARRRALKKLSDARVKNWKNTLQAMREKKLQWKAEKLAQEEAKRQEIDKQEAEVRHTERLEALRRAIAQLNEQTDLMKNFRSAQLYTEVLATRDLQLVDQTKKVRYDKERDKVYHDILKEQMAEYDAKEEAAVVRRKQTEKKVAADQQEQLAAGRARREAEKQAGRVEGQEILQKAQHEVDEDKQKAAERRLWHRRNNEEMTLANMRLNELKKELALKEKEDDEKIAATVKQKEATARARAKAEHDNIEAKQMLRKKMIDRAMEQLSKFQSNESARMEKQAQEMRDKEDNEAAKRAEIRRKQREAIEYSRQLQLKVKAERAVAEKESNKRQAQTWAKRNLELEKEEREAEETKRGKNLEIRHFHEMQMKIVEKRRETERLCQKLGVAQGSALRLEDRDRFATYAKKAIEKTKSEGKPLFPLLKALRQRDEPLLASRVNKKNNRREKDSPKTERSGSEAPPAG